MQTEFVQSQIQVLSEQVKDLGETATKTAKESVKELETAIKTGMESMKDLGETAAKTPRKVRRNWARPPRWRSI